MHRLPIHAPLFGDGRHHAGRQRARTLVERVRRGIAALRAHGTRTLGTEVHPHGHRARSAHGVPGRRPELERARNADAAHVLVAGLIEEPERLGHAHLRVGVVRTDVDVRVRCAPFGKRASEVAHGVRERERLGPALGFEAPVHAAVRALNRAVHVERVEGREELARRTLEARAHGDPERIAGIVDPNRSFRERAAAELTRAAGGGRGRDHAAKATDAEGARGCRDGLHQCRMVAPRGVPWGEPRLVIELSQGLRERVLSWWRFGPLLRRRSQCHGVHRRGPVRDRRHRPRPECHRRHCHWPARARRDRRRPARARRGQLRHALRRRGAGHGYGGRGRHARPRLRAPARPALRPVPEGSDVVSLAHIAASGGPDWVALALSAQGPGDVMLTEPGQPAAVKLAAGLLASRAKAASGGRVRVRGRVERVGSMLVCDELTVLSQPARRIYLDIGLGVLRFLALTTIAIVFWSFVGLPLFATLGRLLTGALRPGVGGRPRRHEASAGSALPR